MKKYTAVIGVIIICLSAMSGCIKRSLPELPGDAAAFEMGTFVDKEHDDASFGTIEYDGRTYIMYGTTNNRYRQSCAETVCCLYHQKKDFISVPYKPRNADYLKRTSRSAVGNRGDDKL